MVTTITRNKRLPSRTNNPRRKNRVVPDQSMSIQEIVKRFVRGIPVDVVQRDKVYVDQSEIDLEKASRADFAEKAELARHMSEIAQSKRDDLEEIERLRSERENPKTRSPKDEKTDEDEPGIDPLDNTMPVDTKRKTK